jgi:hypothetical protein
LQSVFFAALVLLSGCGHRETEDEPDNFADWPARDQRVRENMREVQMAAEHYAGDHGGSTYPKEIDDSFKSYFPGGTEGKTAAVVGPANPYTGMNEFPATGTLKDVKTVRFGQTPPVVKRGRIEYSPLGGDQGYAIIGGGHDDKALMDPNNPDQILVLSNR